MPGYVRKAVMELVHSKPSFYPMPSWTHLSQLHGPKVAITYLLFDILVGSNAGSYQVWTYKSMRCRNFELNRPLSGVCPG